LVRLTRPRWQCGLKTSCPDLHNSVGGDQFDPSSNNLRQEFDMTVTAQLTSADWLQSPPAPNGEYCQVTAHRSDTDILREALALRCQRGSAMFLPWFLMLMLAIESNGVIALRLLKLEAQHEARLMASEKINASFEAGANLIDGATVPDIINRYRQHVAANAIRLS
jgi:hypothetical protein